MFYEWGLLCMGCLEQSSYLGLPSPMTISSLCMQYFILLCCSSALGFCVKPSKSDSMYSSFTRHAWMCFEAESTRVDVADAKLPAADIPVVLCRTDLGIPLNISWSPLFVRPLLGGLHPLL